MILVHLNSLNSVWRAIWVSNLYGSDHNFSSIWLHIFIQLYPILDTEKVDMAVEGGLDSLFNLYAYDDDNVREY